MHAKVKIQSLIVFQTSLTCSVQHFLSPVKWKEYTNFVYFNTGREEIEDFLDDIGQSFGRDKIRVKLNNERKITDERKKMRLDEIGVQIARKSLKRWLK